MSNTKSNTNKLKLERSEDSNSTRQLNMTIEESFGGVNPINSIAIDNVPETIEE